MLRLFLLLLLVLSLPLIPLEAMGKAYLDRAVYGPGHIVYVTIVDPNFNRSRDVIESIDLTRIVDGKPILEIIVTQPTQGRLFLNAVDGSLRDADGRPVTQAVESGSNTSRFEFMFKLPDDLESNSSVSAIYNDPFKLTPTTRTDIPVDEKVRISEVRMTDRVGATITDAAVEREIIFRATIQSSMNVAQQYAFVLNVRDADGYTVALSWISGGLEAKGAASASIAWTPDASGEYTVEMFLWDKMTNPTPLMMEVKKKVLMVS